jgi:predicted hydrolase (HD superfamily)
MKICGELGLDIDESSAIALGATEEVSDEFGL